MRSLQPKDRRGEALFTPNGSATLVSSKSGPDPLSAQGAAMMRDMVCPGCHRMTSDGYIFRCSKCGELRCHNSSCPGTYHGRRWGAEPGDQCNSCRVGHYVCIVGQTRRDPPPPPAHPHSVVQQPAIAQERETPSRYPHRVETDLSIEDSGQSGQHLDERIAILKGLLAQIEEKEAQTPKVTPEMFAQLEKSSQEGDIEALIQVGNCYGMGNGCKADSAKARDCYRKAADQGSARGQVCYAQMRFVDANVYINPKIHPDERHAILMDATAWLMMAADQRFAPALEALGRSYERGRGVAKDQVVAAMWYTLAIQNGGDPECLQKSEITLSKADQEAATALAADWRPSSLLRQSLRRQETESAKQDWAPGIHVLGHIDPALAYAFLLEAVFVQLFQGRTWKQIHRHLVDVVNMTGRRDRVLLIQRALQVWTALRRAKGDLAKAATILLRRDWDETRMATCALATCQRVAHEFEVPLTKKFPAPGILRRIGTLMIQCLILVILLFVLLVVLQATGLIDLSKAKPVKPSPLEQ